MYWCNRRTNINLFSFSIFAIFGSRINRVAQFCIKWLFVQKGLRIVVYVSNKSLHILFQQKGYSTQELVVYIGRSWGSSRTRSPLEGERKWCHCVTRHFANSTHSTHHSTLLTIFGLVGFIIFEEVLVRALHLVIWEYFLYCTYHI